MGDNEIQIRNKDEYGIGMLWIRGKQIFGGYVNNCSALLSLFVGKKKAYGYYLVIDENSASAAESFVLNMRDFDETKDKVVVVGEISYGKGIAQSFLYPYATNFDYTTSVRYTSPRRC